MISSTEPFCQYIVTIGLQIDPNWPMGIQTRVANIQHRYLSLHDPPCCYTSSHLPQIASSKHNVYRQHYTESPRPFSTSNYLQHLHTFNQCPHYRCTSRPNSHLHQYDPPPRPKHPKHPPRPPTYRRNRRRRRRGRRRRHRRHRQYRRKTTRFNQRPYITQVQQRRPFLQRLRHTTIIRYWRAILRRWCIRTVSSGRCERRWITPIPTYWRRLAVLAPWDVGRRRICISVSGECDVL